MPPPGELLHTTYDMLHAGGIDLAPYTRLFEAMAAGDLDAIASRRQEIDRLEHAADEIKHEIRRHLPRRMFLAIERRDMLEILDYQDSIADVAQDIAELVDLRGMVIPKDLVERMRKADSFGVGARTVQQMFYAAISLEFHRANW